MSLGTGLGAGFADSTALDGLSFKQTFDGKDPNNSQFSALFANGLFGPEDEIHPLTGYFSTTRAGFDMAFTGADSFQSTGLFGDYASLFGPMLSYDELPQGYFFDADGNPDTDDVLIAHQLADGSWVQNRLVDENGIVTSFAYGNDGVAYDDEAALFDALVAATGYGACPDDPAAPAAACLAGADRIDDLAKFNLSFFIDPTGFDGDQFTLRIESSAVPEPGSLALAALALGVAGASRRRRPG